MDKNTLQVMQGVNDSTGSPQSVKINSDGQLHVVMEGELCTTNSTSTPLLADAVFTGTAQNILAYQAICIFITSNVGSATGGLVAQFSEDGSTNWRDGESYTVLAGAEKFFTPPAQMPYFRIKYTNGDTGQTTFQLTTTLKKSAIKWSGHNIDDPIKDQDDAELVKAVITGKNAQGNYVNFQATTAGNFKISVEEYDETVNPVRSDVEGGGKIAVGTTAVEVTFTGVTRGILITADIDNTGMLYVGKSNVTNLGANSLTYLQPGDALQVDYDDSTNALYVVASAVSQNFWKGATL